MSYTSRYRFKTRREKNQIFFKRLKMVILFIILVSIVIAIKNRVYIRDVITTSFY